MAHFDGWEIELLIHAKNTIDAAPDWAIRNLNNIVSRRMRMERPVYKERYLTVVFMVAIAASEIPGLQQVEIR